MVRGLRDCCVDAVWMGSRWLELDGRQTAELMLYRCCVDSEYG